MWIKEIFIESFGLARQVAVRDLGPGINLILGLNEAGKTTTLEFVRSVFFGFKKFSGHANIYESADGTLRRGRLTLYSPVHGLLRVERAEKRGLREGVLTVTDAQGHPVEPSSLAVFRSGMDRNVYESLFAFDLDAVSRLDQRALRGKITAMALGSLRVNPVEVQGILKERLNRLSRPAAGNGDSLASLEHRLKSVERRLTSLAERPARYARLQEELELVNTERREIASEIKATEASLHEVERILRLEDDWTRLVLLEGDLSQLRDYSDFPPDGLVRFEQAVERRREVEESLLGLEATMEHLREEERTLHPDPVYSQYADKIHSLSREALRLGESPSEIERLDAALRSSREALEEDISSLGPGWDRESIRTADSSIHLELEIRGLIDSRRACRDRIGNLDVRLTEAREKCARLLSKVSAHREELKLLAPRCKDFLSPEALQMLQQWKAHFTRASDLEERLSEKRGRLEDLIARRQEVEARLCRLADYSSPPIPPILFRSLFGLAAVSGLSMLYGAWASDGPIRYLFLALGAAMLVSVPLLIRHKILADRKKAYQMAEECRVLASWKEKLTLETGVVENERRRILAQIEYLRREHEQIALDVLGDAHPELGSVLDAERRSAAAEESVRRRRMLEAGLETETAELAAEESIRSEIQGALQDARDQFQALERNWDAVITGSGLEPGVDPETALASLQRVRDLKASVLRLSGEENALSAKKREWADFAEKVRRLGTEMHMSGSPDTNLHSKSPLPPLCQRGGRGDSLTHLKANWYETEPADQVAHWLRAEQEAREVMARKGTLSRTIADLKVRLGVLEKKARHGAEQVHALLGAARAEDEESFRKRAAFHEQFKLGMRDRQGLLDRLITSLGVHEEAEARALMEGQDWDGNSDFATALAAELDSLRARSERLADAKGRLQGEIASLEADEDSEQLLSQREELRARLNRVAARWISLKTASWLLEEAIRVYETEKQPEVLAKGTDVFRSMTGNAYLKIMFPLGQDTAQVERSDGAVSGEGVLSRGTLEQLYLALRLAHLSVYHRDEPIPVLMDDVLANFDPDRGRWTAEELVCFSEDTGTQVLFFTCHPATAALFPQETVRMHLQLSGVGSRLEVK